MSVSILALNILLRYLQGQLEQLKTEIQQRDVKLQEAQNEGSKHLETLNRREAELELKESELKEKRIQLKEMHGNICCEVQRLRRTALLGSDMAPACPCWANLGKIQPCQLNGTLKVREIPPYFLMCSGEVWQSKQGLLP